MRKLLMVLTVVALGSSALAELKLATVFSDGMVLQRGQKVPVWGWAEPGTKVLVTFAGKEKTSVASAGGKWQVVLDPMSTNAKPQVLQISGFKSQVSISNVLVGEVWLCSGQSNMGMMVGRSKDADKEKAAADFPEIRMFLTARQPSTELEDTCKGNWTVCSPDTVSGFTAAGYFFGRKIHQELGVPVGLLHSSWGGTCVEAWSPMASLEQYPAVMDYKSGYDRRAESFTEEGEKKRYADALVKWEAQVAKAKEAGKKGPKKPKKKNNPHKDQNYPANLYNGMIHPHVPYGIRGAIWYQGERNAHTFENAVLYRDLLENMVQQWRKDWDSPFPFYAVQLVNYKKEQVAPVEDTPWAFIRESFLKFHKEVPNVGIAVGIDVGEAKDIHPKNKQAIGLRLAHQALAKTYGKDVVAGGPIYSFAKTEGNKIIISFEDIGSGLTSLDGAPLKTFAIAGVDRKFVMAQAEIVGNTVVVSSPDIWEPKSVRYAWADNPVDCNLGNEEGFPASPFRTDNWDPLDQ